MYKWSLVLQEKEDISRVVPATQVLMLEIWKNGLARDGHTES